MLRRNETIMTGAPRLAKLARFSAAVSALVAGGLSAGVALADTADAPVKTGPVTTTSAEGVSVDEVVIRVERDRAAAAAPSKASLDETQPEAIISHNFIEQSRPETGDYTTTVLLAPSMAGISSNGGGVGETNKISLRGFSDGNFNLTYDQISFGDTNNPTHHPASYFPASTIGTAVVDRGPGAAGDLGQANYGGAVHLFSPPVNDTPSASEKATYASFGTVESVSTFQTGDISQLAGTKILLNVDYRKSDGELSYSGGTAENYLFKSVTNLPANWTMTMFSAVNTTQFYQADAGPGETWAQVEAYGKNYALSNNPTQFNYYGYNNQHKNTDFEYIDLKGGLFGFDIDNQAYTYFYSNKTWAANSVTVVDTSATSGVLSTKNPSPPSYVTTADPSTDIGGYYKGNRYRVEGDVLRFTKDLPWGALKFGAWYEHSDTDRHNVLYDLSNGNADNKYASLTTPPVAHSSNIKTLEDSSWDQYQIFVDFYWRPIAGLTITPGFKYVDFTRNISAPVENSGLGTFARSSLYGSNTYTKPLYFLTANYKILSYWSTYFQYATGFLIPQLSDLVTATPSLNNDPPSLTTNYQVGTVFTKGNVTFDADYYNITVTNQQVPDPTTNYQYDINVGTAKYSGYEGEVSYALDGGFAVFANGSLNVAKDTTTNLTIDPSGGKELTGVPKATAALGVLYNHNKLQGSFTYKLVGPQVANYTSAGQAIELPRYGTLDGSISYDFGHFKGKLAIFNLLDNRAITNFTGSDALYSPLSTGLYQFQAGRQIEGTLQAKF
jgi:iron complex outermembrane receptor protein